MVPNPSTGSVPVIAIGNGVASPPLAFTIVGIEIAGRVIVVCVFGLARRFDNASIDEDEIVSGSTSQIMAATLNVGSRARTIRVVTRSWTMEEETTRGDLRALTTAEYSRDEDDVSAWVKAPTSGTRFSRPPRGLTKCPSWVLFGASSSDPSMRRK